MPTTAENLPSFRPRKHHIVSFPSSDMTLEIKRESPKPFLPLMQGDETCVRIACMNDGMYWGNQPPQHTHANLHDLLLYLLRMEKGGGWNIRFPLSSFFSCVRCNIYFFHPCSELGSMEDANGFIALSAESYGSNVFLFLQRKAFSIAFFSERKTRFVWFPYPNALNGYLALVPDKKV